MATKKQPAMSPSDMPVDEVLDRITGPRRAEAEELIALHREVSGFEPVVWAGRIFGFGEYEYHYASGHSGTAPLLGFATNSSKHTVYLANDFSERWPDLVRELGPHQASKVCLYFTRLSNIDREILRTMLERSLAETRAAYC